MEYKLKNGKSVIIRKPTTDNTLAIINIITVADTELFTLLFAKLEVFQQKTEYAFSSSDLRLYYCLMLP